MNDLSHSLLYRSPLRPSESLPSFLIRLAKGNFYHSPTMVTQLCQERLTQRDQVTRPTQTETYRILAQLIRIGVDELYAASVQCFASTVAPPDYGHRSILLPSGKTAPVLTDSILRQHTRPESDVQFCPLCLKESAHHRIEWFPLAVSVCSRHQSLLIRGCPNCQERIRVRDVLETRCSNCGFELTQAPIARVAVDQFGLFSQSVIQSWFGLCSPMSANNYAPLPDEPPASLYRLLDGLRRAVMSVQHSWSYLYDAPSGVRSPFFPCASKGDITPAKSYILYATAFRAMVNWPQGFYNFLDAYRLRDGQLPSGHIRRDLGRLYSVWLKKSWRHPAFRFVQEAFDRYLLRSH
jgi:hypothetical protein